MTRLLPLLPLIGLLVATPALAVDLGTTAGLGFNDSYGGPGLPNSVETLPSLDLRTEPVILQLYLLDFVAGLASEQVVFSGNVLFDVVREPVTDNLEAVVQPGGSFDLISDPFAVALGATSRFGVEAQREAGVGAYIVPTLGVVTVDGDLGLFMGGRVEMSVWF